MVISVITDVKDHDWFSHPPEHSVSGEPGEIDEKDVDDFYYTKPSSILHPPNSNSNAIPQYLIT
jgi:hypothetical protein